jgi:ESX-1-secreted protein regulator
MADPTPMKRTFAEKLDHLFRTVHPAGRGPYSYNEAAAGIRERGVSISSQYLWLLRKGERDNPTLQHLEAIADFFGVPAAYFLDDEMAEKVDRDLELFTALKDGSVRVIALEARGLSAGSQETVLNVIKQVRMLESRANDSNRG